ncbi:hypothetical protein HAZT_HAZT002027 [Hyalella azteca]|uniref:Thioredoxin domain-containing protein n=1 Tax=Hyalella azteca TaxID=294128 RepID=A0A6A0H9C9_HYAAZ|nr:hypothetical protein HAZT_HAZT002027 [Hyalella azteca]
MAPDYAAAAQQLRKDGLYLAKVDATVESALSKHYGVTGYPTIKYFQDGKLVEDYPGGRTTAAIVEYMKRRSDPNYKPPPSDVIELVAEDFDEKVKAAPLMLVIFYSPTNAASQQVAPEYSTAATTLLKDGIPLAKIDAQSHPDIAKTYGVFDYPTLKVFRHGQAFEYKGRRGADHFISYMREMALLPSEDLRTSLNAKNAVQRNLPTIFGYFSDKTSKFYENFITAANTLRGDLKFVHTFEASVAAMYGIPVDTMAVIMPEIYQSQYEDKIRVMAEASTSDWTSLVSWAKSKSVPLLAAQHLRLKLLPLLIKHRDAFTFAMSNEDAYSDEMTSVGLGETGEDVNAAIFTGREKYAMEPDEDYMEELEEFITKYRAGKLKPYLRSQPVPKKQTGPVKVLVARNFEETVLSGSKDYLVEFYAPWCGHCKKLEPEYKKLAKDLATSQPDVVVGKFDATANDIPTLFGVKGFPTIYYVSAKDLENPVPFEGDRTLAGLKEFVLQQRASHASKDEL